MTWSLFVYTLAICIYSGHIYDTDIVLNFDELSKPFVYKVLMFCYRSFFMLIILQAFSSYSLVKHCQFSDKNILSILALFVYGIVRPLVSLLLLLFVLIRWLWFLRVTKNQLSQHVQIACGNCIRDTYVDL